MNIIKETLKKTFDELGDQISHHETLRKTHLVGKASKIVTSMDDLFKDFHLTVTDTSIQFKLVEDSWYDFRIERRTNWKSEGYEYSKATLSTSSVSDASTNGLKKLMCLGILAKHCLDNSAEWNELVSLMDETNEIYKANIKPLYNKFYQIEREIKIIEQDEQDKLFQETFSKNTIKLDKETTFWYGSGKWDRVHSNEWFWAENKGGKTFTVSYMDERRTNPHFDENGNVLEPTYERVKRVIDKRVKKADIESFVRKLKQIVDSAA